MRNHPALLDKLMRSSLLLLFLLSGASGFAQFPTYDSFDPGANDIVYSLVPQPDGRVLVGGQFTVLGGQARVGAGRVNSDGTLDTLFIPGLDGGSPSMASSFLLMTNGRIVVGGSFTTLGGQSHANLGRLNPDGSVDANFTASADGPIKCLAQSADGKILIGGSFTKVNGLSRLNLARLNGDGTLDLDFEPGAIGGSGVNCIAPQPDGKLLVGGGFNTLGGQNCSFLGRLNPDASRDVNFNPNPGKEVTCLALEAYDTILVGGFFNTVGGIACNFLARVNQDGSLDTTFTPEPNGVVYCLGLQSDGEILVGGTFDKLLSGTWSVPSITRLLGSGRPDSIYFSATNYAYCLSLQTDGKVLAGGTSTILGGQIRNHLGRLNIASVAATQKLTYDGANLTWLRGGSSPEVWRTTFEYSTNGVSWFALGQGDRILDGWRMTNVFVPQFATIRSRGFISGGSWHTSSWFAEKTMDRPAFASQPQSLATNLGATCEFSASPAVLDQTTFQWQKDGVRLTNTANLSGSTSAKLSVSNLQHSDSGGYSVVLGNGVWNQTSMVASLTVLDPFITSGPTNQTKGFGSNVIVSASLGGTLPINVHWYKNGALLQDGANVSGATSPALSLTAISGADAGSFSLIASNVFGSATSAVATLVVLDPLITIPPTGQVATISSNLTLSATVKGTQPITYQWRKNGINLPGATQPTLSLTNLQVADAAIYDLVANNIWGSANSSPAVLSINTSFPDPPLANQPNNPVFATALEADGRILICGQFDFFRNSSATSHGSLARLQMDGSVDPTFDPVAQFAGGGTPIAIAIQPDKKFIVAGGIMHVANQWRTNLSRFNDDGSLDPGFTPGMPGVVQCLAIQPDKKILVSGTFTALAGGNRTNIGRLNADGTLDSAFVSSADQTINAIAIQPDGRILVAGYFTSLNGQPRNAVGRLNPDGSLDPTFNPGAVGKSLFGAAPVGTLALQSDGKILLGGYLTNLAGQRRLGIGRLNSDGTLDTGFYPITNGVTSFEIDSFALQADGKILVGGQFNAIGGQNRTNLARLNPDGTLDPTFCVSAGGLVQSLSLQMDGRILVAGSLRSLNGLARDFIGRLSNTIPATQNLGCDNSTITWLRGGSLPEVWRTTFDYSPDAGTTWVNLGAGTRIPGGWQLSELSLPNPATVRARGFVESGTGSEWFLESTINVTSLTQIGMPDTFTPAGITNRVTAFCPATDNKLFFAGDLGVPIFLKRGFVGEVNANTQETINFISATNGYHINCAAVQPDGRFLVGGFFSNVSGANLTNLARLNADGSPDLTFNPAPKREVFALALQPDGKILIGGSYLSPKGFLTRLNPDGSSDTNFLPPSVSSAVYTLAVQPDGKILAGGSFFSVGGTNVTFPFVRLNSDGTRDMSFTPTSPGSSTVNCTLIQPDGKILVGGRFSEVGGKSRIDLARLNSDGTLDFGFSADTDPGGGVDTIALQTDGKILVGGTFATLGGQSRIRIGRVNPDGSIDEAINPGADGEVFSLAQQDDGKILVGGLFSTLGSRPRTGVGRLNNSGPASQKLSFDGLTITWLRGGASPEVWRTTFESSSDGTTWTKLGDGKRIPGGWQLAWQSKGPGMQLRARGFAVGGYGESSAYLLEAILPAPLSISYPQISPDAKFGFNASGTVSKTFIIESSYDLLLWTPLQTNVFSTNALFFQEQSSLQSLRRFYRLRQEP